MLIRDLFENDDDLFAPSDRLKKLRRVKAMSVYRYVRDVLKARWPEAEPLILQDPYSAYQYALHVLKARWPEAEPVIRKEPHLACVYAQEVIGGRWPEAEPVIRRDPQWAYQYALHVLKARWPEAEPVIRQSHWAYEYKRHFKIQDDLTENDDDLFADPVNVTDIVDALDEVADHWAKAGPAVDEDDPDWYHLANMLHDAAVIFTLHGVMQGMRALARIDVWEALADSLEFLGYEDIWTKIEQYIDHLNEAVDNEDEPELSAAEREANLKKFLEPSHPDTQKVLYRGQRRAPKPHQFVLQKGRDTPSFTDDPEVANVYSRQLDIGTPEHGPGSTSVPVYLQMSRPLDIRGLGEYFSLLDFVAVLPNVDLSQETIPNGLGWYDLSAMVSDLDELIYRTGAKSEIEASGSDNLFTIRDFEELAQEIAVSGEEGDLGQIEYMLSETQIDSFIVADSTDIVSQLTKMGYDGVILSDIFTAGAPYYQGDVDKLQTGAWDDEDRVITAYRPFDQGKIKSAIGNRGTYNTADPDITRESESTKYSK